MGIGAPVFVEVLTAIVSLASVPGPLMIRQIQRLPARAGFISEERESFLAGRGDAFRNRDKDNVAAWIHTLRRFEFDGLTQPILFFHVHP